MKLHDAIKEAMLSKTRIRRQSWYEKAFKVVGDGDSSAWYAVYTEEEVLADDWVVEKIALKPCPLCGGTAELGEEEPSHEEGGFPKPGKAYIKCSNSECIIDIEETLRFITKEEFIKKWNTRTGEK